MIAYLLIACLNTLRPLLGPAVCLYGRSCTQYAQDALTAYSLPKALFLITKRILLCNPLHNLIVRRKMR